MEHDLNDVDTQSKATLSDLAHTRDHNQIISLKRAKWVRQLRIIFPVVATCILLGALVFSDRKDALEATPINEIVSQDVGKNELLNPKFKSKDDKDNPFIITSDRAFQHKKDGDKILLENPNANINMLNGDQLSLGGDQGVFKQEEQTLKLDGNVQLEQNEEYILNTTSVKIDLENQIATSDVEVTGSAPAGDIKASGLNANANNDIIIFKGPATLTLKPKTSD